jgi:hypothetical protein
MQIVTTFDLVLMAQTGQETLSFRTKSFTAIIQLLHLCLSLLSTEPTEL